MGPEPRSPNQTPAMPLNPPFSPGRREPAEICLYAGRPEKVGLRFMFLDWRDVEALAAAADLPREILDDEKIIRKKFDLTRGHWIKIGYVDGRPRVYSQYFAIAPGHHYPISTLRLFLKMYGASGAHLLEELLAPGLNDPGSIWNLALKRDADGAHPRIYGRVRRSVLGALLERAVSTGLISSTHREAQLEWDGKIRAGRLVYYSVDPGTPGGMAVDYEELPAALLPFSPELFQAGLPPDFKLPYLKCRIRDGKPDPEWVAHLAWSWFRNTMNPR